MVFAGFSAEALRSRIQHVKAKVVVTVDVMKRSGRAVNVLFCTCVVFSETVQNLLNKVPLKENVDEALLFCPDVKNVIVSRRSSESAMVRGRDLSMSDGMTRQRPWCPPEG